MKWGGRASIAAQCTPGKEIIFSKTNINSPQLTLNNENIKRVHTHKHLGLFLTSNLDWSAQIHYVCLRANRKLAVIRKNKMLNRQTLDMLYKVTVRSVIDYGLPIYYQSLRVTEKTRLEQIQYRAAKIVTGVSHQAKKVKLNEELAWETIKTRADYLGLSIFHKIAQCETRPFIRGCLSQRNRAITRNEGFVTFPFKGMCFANSFFPYFTNKYNHLKKDTINKSVKDFKIELNETMKPTKRKHYSRGNKYANMLLTSLRVEHSKLNAHSFKIGLENTNICANCDKNTQESSLHYLIVCPHFAEQRRTLFDRVEQTFFPKFRKLTQKRQYEILVEGFDPENLELRKINTKIMKFTQDFILSSKRFDEKPPPPPPPPPHIH